MQWDKKGRTAARVAVSALLVFAAMTMAASNAQAGPFSITTTGKITSGTDPSNLLGAGTNLVGDSYSLTITYAGLGPGYFSDGTVAIDQGDAIDGSISVTVAGKTLTTAIVANAAASLFEDGSDLLSSNGGNNIANEFASGSQDVSSATNFVPYPDLQTPFTYVLAAADGGSDTYTFDNAANTSAINFSGTTQTIALAVPEPASWALLLGGLLGLGMIRRRRTS